MRLRPYTLADKPPCVALFSSNIPKFFAPHELADFEVFLDEPECDYFVVEHDNGDLIGCGGYYINTKSRAGALCWGMIGNAHHHTGAGRFLLVERLRRICAEGTADQVLIDTSQHTAPFFAKAGFVTERILEDHYAPDLHSYEMVLHIDADYCRKLNAAYQSDQS